MCVCSVLTERDYSPLSHPVTFALSLHEVLILSFTQEKHHNQVGGLRWFPCGAVFNSCAVCFKRQLRYCCLKGGCLVWHLLTPSILATGHVSKLDSETLRLSEKQDAENRTHLKMILFIRSSK